MKSTTSRSETSSQEQLEASELRSAALKCVGTHMLRCRSAGKKEITLTDDLENDSKQEFVVIALKIHRIVL